MHFFEVPLCGANLLRKQIGAVLQVATDVTHLMIPPVFASRPQTTKARSSSGQILWSLQLRSGVTF